MKTAEKQMKTDDKLTELTETLNKLRAFMMDHTKNSEYSPAQKYTWTPLDPTTVVPANKRVPTLEGGHPTKSGGM